MGNKHEYYFDDPEIGIDRETSHPKYNAIIHDQFYFDCLDEFSPFGNDEGAETLMALNEWFNEKSEDEDVVDWMLDRIDGYGFPFQADIASMLQDSRTINEVHEEDDNFFLCMDETIIATAFGQYKISGLIDEELKKVGLIAIDRQILLSRQDLQNGGLDLRKLYKVVDQESTRPDANGSTSHLTHKYLERLGIMKRDLQKFEVR